MSEKRYPRTQWFRRNEQPVRKGIYECTVQVSSSVPPLLWMLEWDGVGFLVPCPMIVRSWRGLKKEQQ